MNKDKALVIPDIHYIVDRDRDYKQLDFILDFIKSYSTVFFLGDFFHFKQNSLTLPYYNALEYFFTNIPNSTTFYGLVGNHDITLGVGLKNGELHSWLNVVAKFLNKPNIHIITKPEIIKLNNLSIQLQPYGIHFKIKPADILITHNSTEYYFKQFGAVGDGYNIKQTDKLLSIYKLIISGHIHQKWQYKNWYYIGYVIPVNFSFLPEHNYMAELNLDTLSLDYIDLHKHNNGVYRYYRMVRYEDYLKDEEEIMDSTDNIRVYVPNAGVYHKLLSESKPNSHIQFKIEKEKESVNKENIISESKKITEIDINRLIEQYVSQSKTKGLDKDKVAEYGKQLVEIYKKKEQELNNEYE